MFRRRRDHGWICDSRSGLALSPPSMRLQGNFNVYNLFKKERQRRARCLNLKLRLVVGCQPSVLQDRNAMSVTVLWHTDVLMLSLECFRTVG
jgi:hypothetical protein